MTSIPNAVRAGAALLMLTGCPADTGLDCTEIGCVSGTTLTLTAAGGALALGDYEVRLTSDEGAAESCTFSVIDACAGGDRCVDADEACNAWYTVGSGSSDSVMITYGELTGELAVEVWLDGELAVDETADPETVTSTPNGEECPPVCENRDLGIELP